MTLSYETGNSSILMVLMLSLLGLMMLSGLSSHHAAQRQSGVKEIKWLTRYTSSQSALSWGEQQNWPLREDWQCQTDPSSSLRACLYQIEGDRALLAGECSDDDFPDRLVLWRWGWLKKDKFIAHPHGWLDYCPLRGNSHCHLAQ